MTLDELRLAIANLPGNTIVKVWDMGSGGLIEVTGVYQPHTDVLVIEGDGRPQ